MIVEWVIDKSDLKTEDPLPGICGERGRYNLYELKMLSVDISERRDSTSLSID